MASDKSVNDWVKEIESVFGKAKAVRGISDDGREYRKGVQDVLGVDPVRLVGPVISGSSLFDANGFLITPDRVVGSRKRK